MKNINNTDDYSRRTGSVFSRILAKLRSPILSTYALFRKSPPMWNLLNRSGNKLFKKHSPKLDELQNDILNNLMANGIAYSSLDELFPGKEKIPRLKMASKQKKEMPELNHKGFLKYSLGMGSTIDLNDPLNQLSIHPRILQIVNSYISRCSKLTYFDLATTNVNNKGDLAAGSQRWHRDPALHPICKMFVYLSDVNENAGPFTYVLESHVRGMLGKIFPQKQFGRHGFYPPDGAVEKLVPNDNLKICTGKMGSIIFCDTTGLHKGGYALSKPRTMYTSTYMSEGETTRRSYKYPNDFNKQLDNLDVVSRFAVT